MKRSLSVIAAAIAAGCYDDARCHPRIETRDSLAAESSVVNEAEWVDRRRETFGSSSFENTVLTDGLLARRLFVLIDTAHCSDRALRVVGPSGSTVKQTRRAAVGPAVSRCEPPGCDYSEIQVVDVSVDWTATKGTSSIEILNTSVPLHVASNGTDRVALAIVPRYCAFVARLGPQTFVCDGAIFDSTGTELSKVDHPAIDALGSTWIGANDAGVIGAYRWDGRVVALGEYSIRQTGPRPVLTESGVLVPTDGGLSFIDFADGGVSQVLNGGTPLAVARSPNGPVWLDATGAQACSLGRDGVGCLDIEGKPVGTDRGLWLDSESKASLTLVTKSIDGLPELRATGPRISHPRFAPLGYFKPYRVPLHPGFLATRAMCAFREVQLGAIGLTVLPEGSLGPEQTPQGLDIWAFKGAAGDGYEGIRWCTDDRMSRTYVYDGE